MYLEKRIKRLENRIATLEEKNAVEERKDSLMLRDGDYVMSLYHYSGDSPNLLVCIKKNTNKRWRCFRADFDVIVEWIEKQKSQN